MTRLAGGQWWSEIHHLIRSLKASVTWTRGCIIAHCDFQGVWLPDTSRCFLTCFYWFTQLITSAAVFRSADSTVTTALPFRVGGWSECVFVCLCCCDVMQVKCVSWTRHCSAGWIVCVVRHCWFSRSQTRLVSSPANFQSEWIFHGATVAVTAVWLTAGRASDTNHSGFCLRSLERRRRGQKASLQQVNCITNQPISFLFSACLDFASATPPCDQPIRL